jgi:magnesium transporter
MRQEKQPVVPGSPPGAIDRALEVGQHRMSAVDYTRQAVTAVEESVVAMAPPGVNRWIRICGAPDRPTLEMLRDELGVHTLVLEDVMSQGTRIKVEEYDDCTFVVLHATTLTDDDQPSEVEIDIVLFENTLVTVNHGADGSLFDPIDERLARSDSFIRRSGIDVLYYAIVDLIVDLLFPVADRMESEIDRLEEEILASLREEQLGRIQHLRGSAQRLRLIAGSTRFVVARIERSGHQGLSDATRFYFRDVHDHIIHLLEAFGELKEETSNLMEVYRSGTNNKINDVMKVLTIISTVFIPITFIAGIYGMNFAHMPELSVRWAYPAVVGVMAAIVVGMLVFFKRKKWF